MNFLLNQPSEFLSPEVHWQPLIPVIIVLAGAVIGILIEAFSKYPTRRTLTIGWSLLVTAAAFVAAVSSLNPAAMDPELIGEYVDDTLTVALQIVLTFLTFIALLVMADRTSLKDGAFAAQPSDRPGSGEEALSIAKSYQRSEFFPLALFSLGGMMLFPATDSLLTMFIALEVMSLPLYILVATSRRKRELSMEAALKYFILGSFASGFFLMGSALLYGFSGGSLRLGDIGASIPVLSNMDGLLLVGVFMVLVGLLFKVAVFPFHEWAPDVYTGAPTPVTGFMAAGVKVAAFGALLRFYVAVAGHLTWDFGFILALLAAATIIIGTVGSLVQKDIKRLLAYSSISHAGFILIGILALTPKSAGAVIFYLLSYGLATIGAFAVVTLVRHKGPDGSIAGEANDLRHWDGLGRRSPLLGFAMLVYLMSFAGIPLTAGFVGKFVVFSAGMQAGLAWLVAIGLAASVATAAVYFRIVQAMFFREPAEDTAVAEPEFSTTLAIVITVMLTLILGIVPGWLLQIVDQVKILIP